VRTVAVVVLDEYSERPLEVPLANDQEPVETLGARGSDEALGNRVRLRRAHRCADDLDPFASEDGVEVTRELAVAIPDEEAQRRRSLRQFPGELASLLGNQDGPAGC
jgi:hypothetical protein